MVFDAAFDTVVYFVLASVLTKKSIAEEPNSDNCLYTLLTVFGAFFPALYAFLALLFTPLTVAFVAACVARPAVD